MKLIPKDRSSKQALLRFKKFKHCCSDSIGRFKDELQCATWPRGSESVPGRGLRICGAKLPFALRNIDHAVAARHITARLGLNGDPSGFHLMHPSESRLWHHYIIDAWRTEFTS